MLVAKIAELQLNSSDVARINRLLSAWEGDYPGMSDVVDSAVWMDHVKCSQNASFCQQHEPDALGEFSAWHYADLSFNPDNVSKTLSRKRVFDNPSSVWGLSEAMRTLHSASSPWGQNFALRLVLHVLGDLHQPLHSAQGYFNDTRFGYLPEGDRGGNLIPIRPPQWDEIRNLHALWDAAAGLYFDNWPLTVAQQAELTQNASTLIQAHPTDSLPNYAKDDLNCAHRQPYSCKHVFGRWASEGYELAVHEVYAHGLRAGDAPSEAYLENVRRVAQRQIALAGYRLADLLREAVLPRLPPATVAATVLQDGKAEAYKRHATPVAATETVGLAALQPRTEEQPASLSKILVGACLLQSVFLLTCLVLRRRDRLLLSKYQEPFLNIDSDESSPDSELECV